MESFEVKLLKSQINAIHKALVKAVEEGDELRLGIIIGQTIVKLEQIVSTN